MLAGVNYSAAEGGAAVVFGGAHEAIETLAIDSKSLGCVRNIGRSVLGFDEQLAILLHDQDTLKSADVEPRADHAQSLLIAAPGHRGSAHAYSQRQCLIASTGRSSTSWSSLDGASSSCS